MSAPSKALCRLVDERDGHACVRCGRSLQATSGSRHHRLRRRDGGHRASILVLLCGSGTTGCHGWVHANPRAARALGYIIPALRSALDPEVVPMWTFAHGWLQLNDRGTSTRLREAEARELLAVFGMGSEVA